MTDELILYVFLRFEKIDFIDFNKLFISLAPFFVL